MIKDNLRKGIISEFYELLTTYSSENSQYKLNALVELNRYNKNIPDICTKCMEARVTLFHCIWQCRMIQLFWEEVRVIIEKIKCVALLWTKTHRPCTTQWIRQMLSSLPICRKQWQHENQRVPMIWKRNGPRLQ